MPEAVPPPVHPTAAIIPFPVRPFPVRPQAAERRLQDALARLDAALAAQRTAVADWRHALANLRITVGGLGDGPHPSPHCTPGTNLQNSPLRANISANRCISGSSRCSGMLGISS